MEIVQSFIFSLARVRLSLYEQRILLRVVESAQVYLHGLWLKDNLKQIDGPTANVRIDIVVKDLLTEGSKHYEDVKEAVLSLQKRTMEYYDSTKRTWYATPIIYNASMKQGSGVITFYVASAVFRCILDFTKGFSRYNLEKALQLPSPYAVRMYALMASQTHPITLKVEELYKTFDVVGKYSQTSDFIKKIIDTAKANLDSLGMSSFTYSTVRSGRRISAITFTPVRRDLKAASALMAQLPLSALVAKELKISLMQKFGFSARELSAHKQLLERFGKIDCWPQKLMEIEHRVKKGDKTKGYTINAIKGVVSDFYGSKSDNQ